LLAGQQRTRGGELKQSRIVAGDLISKRIRPDQVQGRALPNAPTRSGHASSATTSPVRSRSSHRRPDTQGANKMALRSGLTITARHSDAGDPAPELFSQRKMPDIKPFRLQVDRQTKSSYDSLETAEAAGLAIKTAHPVVQVSIYDVIACENRLIELPAP
jgi:hypothetical protein